MSQSLYQNILCTTRNTILAGLDRQGCLKIHWIWSIKHHKGMGLWTGCTVPLIAFLNINSFLVAFESKSAHLVTHNVLDFPFVELTNTLKPHYHSAYSALRVVVFKVLYFLTHSLRLMNWSSYVTGYKTKKCKVVPPLSSQYDPLLI